MQGVPIMRCIGLALCHISDIFEKHMLIRVAFHIPDLSCANQECRADYCAMRRKPTKKET